MTKRIDKSTPPVARPRLGSQLCKRILAVLASSVLVLTAWCASGTWYEPRTGTTWSFDYSGAAATITGGTGYWPAVVIPETVYVGSTPYEVTGIGDKAFDATVDAKASTINLIVFPDTVKAIGERAFYGCGNLVTLNLVKGLETIKASAFENAARLSRVALPSSVDTIGAAAFSGCSALETVTFAGDAASISMNLLSVFAGTPFLDRLNVNDNLTGAIGIGGTKGKLSACNVLATMETGEPPTVADSSITQML